MQKIQIYGKVLNARILDQTAFVKMYVHKVTFENGTITTPNQAARFSLAFGENTPIKEETVKFLFEGDEITLYLEPIKEQTYAVTSIKLKDAFSLADVLCM